MQTKMDSLPSVSTECSIYRVPEKLRRANAEAYTPQVISIGPFHCCKKELQSTEGIKLRYLKAFLRRIKADLPACTRMISELDYYIRQCYQEKLTQSSSELVEIILLDAVFVVELFISNYYRNLVPEHRDQNDEILSKQWMSNAVFHDLLLLENQIPFFVLDCLYSLVPLSTTVTFFKLSYEYFKDVFYEHELASTRDVPKPLVDYVRGLASTRDVPKHLVDYVRSLHVRSLHVRALHVPLFPMTPKQGKKFELTRRAKELQDAGVKFARSEGGFSLLDVSFVDGTLAMSHLVVHEWTDAYFRNMIAYEQCHHDDHYIGSYAILLDSLINTPKDIDILISCGILENRLGSTEDVASLIKGMCKEIMRDSSRFLYSSQCRSLNAYSRNMWHRWKAIFNRDYLSKPWFRTAGVLLVLAIVQTVCSLMDVYAGDAGRFFRWHK
ncbi:hypothetical protein BT93_F0722 [Corymbia citriodora subsp. variegata]|nr:hypothetical protein BT93_F0722 [Corymbia citriodora subsp. variegata]